MTAGSNKRPELVPLRSNLLSLNNTVKHSDGTPIVLYRGESKVSYANQFKGLEPDGDYYLANKGTYAASSVDPRVNPVGVVDDQTAIRTAIMFSDGSNLNKSVLAFSLLDSSSIVQFSSMGEFGDWGWHVLDEYERLTGLKTSDKQRAALSLGIDALRIPVSENNLVNFQDYWLVFNRSIVVVALDPELTPYR